MLIGLCAFEKLPLPVKTLQRYCYVKGWKAQATCFCECSIPVLPGCWPVTTIPVTIPVSPACWPPSSLSHFLTPLLDTWHILSHDCFHCHCHDKWSTTGPHSIDRYFSTSSDMTYVRPSKTNLVQELFDTYLSHVLTASFSGTKLYSCFVTLLPPVQWAFQIGTLQEEIR